jgi:hypothetical protein
VDESKPLQNRSSGQAPAVRIKPPGRLFGVLTVAAGAVLAVTGHWILGAAALLALSFVFLARALAAKSLAASQAASSRHAPGATVELRQSFVRARFEAGQEADAEKALAQLDRLEQKYAAFKAMLDARLQPGELTYNRFLGIADTASRTVADQLRSVQESLGALGALQADSRELREERLRRISETLALNERALEEFDRAVSALAGIRTGSMSRPEDMTAVIRDLEEIASRAKRLGSP